MRALWLGRFQPPTIAHFVALLKILDVYNEVTIACVFNSQRPEDVHSNWRTTLDQEDAAAYRPGKNPFLPEEVLAMWNAVINTCRLGARVECCSTPRPQFFDFGRVFPVERYQLVSTGDVERKLMHELMFSRPIQHVTPTFTLHNSEIRTLVQRGQSWIDFIAPGAWHVFHSVDGESRCSAPEGTP